MTIAGIVPTIEAVDREISGGFRSLLFSPNLETLYEQETRSDRERYFILNGQIATVLYLLFLFSDWQMTPDVFRAALIARVGIFTPLFLITWFVLSRRPPQAVREGTSSALAIISVALTMWVLTLSRSPDLAIYQYGTVLIMLFTAVVQRLRIRYAAFTIVSTFVIQIATTTQLYGITPRLTANIFIFFLTASILLIRAAYTLERGQRRAYLLDLRSRILNEHLDRVAKQDPLTGLWNRRHLETMMTSAWTSAESRPRPMSVILLDLDHFKSFNDSYGHIEGDKCLQRISACVRAVVAGDEDSVAVRFGGEEFLVFLDGVTSAAARDVAERIKVALKEAAIPHPALGDGAIVTASFGVATGPAPDLSIERLVAAADDALYVSKRSGRDRIWPVIVDADGSPQAERGDLPIAC